MKTELDLSNLSVLVADDSRFMRRLVVTVLRAFSVRMIVEAETGQEAYDHICSGQCDLVLLDWEFPDRSGESVMRAIRKPGHPSGYQTVIMMSGHDERRRIERALRFGVNGYVAKPVAPATLYAQIRQTILFPRPFIRTPHYFGPNHPLIHDRQSKAQLLEAKAQPDTNAEPKQQRTVLDDMVDIDTASDLIL